MVTLDYMMDEICERLAELLYKHIPREVLWRLVSGIAFSEAATARDRERSEAAAAGEGATAESIILLSQQKGQKIDAIRVLDVMFEQGRFTGVRRAEADEEGVLHGHGAGAAHGPLGLQQGPVALAVGQHAP